MTVDTTGAAPDRDRIAVLAGLVAAIAAGWAYLLLGASLEMDMMDMGGGRLMAMTPAWTPGYAALVPEQTGDIPWLSLGTRFRSTRRRKKSTRRFPRKRDCAAGGRLTPQRMRRSCNSSIRAWLDPE